MGDIPLSGDTGILVVALVYVIRVLVDMISKLVGKSPIDKLILSIDKLIVRIDTEARLSAERRVHFDKNIGQMFSKNHDDNMNIMEKIGENRGVLKDIGERIEKNIAPMYRKLDTISEKIKCPVGKI